MSGVACWLLLPVLAAAPGPHAGKYFAITVVDEQTGRGVPLVELSTVNNIRHWTDSGGIVAFYEPGLMNRSVFFHVKSHGYEFPKDGFGFRGKALHVTEGGSAELKIRRINVAERLYRVTGAGIYRDSVLVGHPVPIREPVLNGQVLGSDSVLNMVYRGRIHWFWGDTNRPGYPLGNFHVPGATSLLPEQGGLDPEVGVDLEYFLDRNGFAKETARLPGEGPTWLSGLVVLGDKSGHERPVATYVKVRPPMVVYERGLVEFNPEKAEFEKIVRFDDDVPTYPEGHPFGHVVEGAEYVYFANPFPVVRVRAALGFFKDPSSYEAYTCLREGSRLDDLRLDRAEDGSLRYGWKKNTPPMSLDVQLKLVREKHLPREQVLPHLRDVATGKPLAAHRGSVYWNDYRRRFVMIATETFGTSMLGEVWYAEADTPEGPWAYARKIVTHEKQSFYNPKQHPMFDQQGGRVIFFEGTYVNTFSGNPDETPRYNYNQIMYKLDLGDPRLVLPVPVYLLSDGEAPNRFGTVERLGQPRGARPVAFFACDRKAEGTVPVYEQPIDGGWHALQAGTPPQAASEGQAEPLFHALPADRKAPPPATVPLYEFMHQDGAKRAYSVDASWSAPGYRRAARPVCLVWRDPTRPTGLPSNSHPQPKEHETCCGNGP